MINMPGSDLDLNALKLPQSTNDKNRTELGQNEFLELMLTQLRNQDPFKPMENGEFIGQMAQFSTVSGIADLTESFQTLSTSLYSTQALQASTMIGRSVLTESSVGTLAEDSSLRGAVDLPNATSSGFVRITNPAGELIRELPLGPSGAGLKEFAWDGIGADGQRVPPGQYLISAGYREAGRDISLTPLLNSKVTSVSLSANGTDTTLTTENGQELRLSQVRSVL
jgi:flagellar basal-body rod modification protein FlgD